MIRGTMARIASFLGLGSLVFLAGCFQVEQKWIVYSDGSGKMVQTVTIDKDQAEMLKNMAPGGAGAGPGAPGANLADSVKGTIGQKVQMVVTAYYEDISKVEQPGVSFSFAKRDDGGCMLKMNFDVEKAMNAAQKGMGGAMGGGDKDGGEDLGEKKRGGENGEKDGDTAPGGMGGMNPGMMEGIMSQMKQTIVFVMPGEVSKASRGEAKGRVVTYAMEGQDMTNPKQKTLTFEVTSGAPTKEAKADFEAFQKEMEGVKKGGAGGGK